MKYLLASLALLSVVVVTRAGDAGGAKKLEALLARAQQEATDRYGGGDYAGATEAARRGLAAARPLLAAQPELRIVLDVGLARADALPTADGRAWQMLKTLQVVRAGRDPELAPADAARLAQAVQAKLQQADRLADKGQADEAITAYRDAIADAVAAHGSRHVVLARGLNNLGMIYFDAANYVQARPLLEQSVAILRGLPAKDHQALPGCLDRLANTYQRLGEYARSESTYLESLELRQTLHQSAAEQALSRQGLAYLHLERGRFERAQKLYEECLKAYRATDAAAFLRPRVMCLNDLAMIHCDLADYPAAEKLMDEARTLGTARLPGDRLLLAQCKQYRAELHQHRGEFAEAERLYKELLQEYDRYPAFLATCQQNLANVYRQLGRDDEAEPLYQACRTIREKVFGLRHPEVALIWSNLANLCQAKGQLREAEKLLRGALAIREAAFGNAHIVVANTLGPLARVAELTGRPAEAEKLYLRCLEIQKGALGADGRDVATTLDNLGWLDWQTGRLAEAEERLGAALQIRRERLPDGHRDLALSYHHLAAALAGRGRPAAALGLFEQDRRIVRRFTARVLPMLAVPQQLRFLRGQEERDLAVALSLALAPDATPEVVAQSAGWLVNGQSVAHEVLAASILAGRDRDDPATGKRARELEQVRTELTGLTLTVPPAGAEKAQRDRFDALARREQELAVALRGQGSALAAAGRWVEPEEIRKALPADAAFIDIARFRPLDFAAGPGGERRKPARYVAWITRPTGPIALVDLGEAEPIDREIARLRAALAAAQKETRDVGEPASEAALRIRLEGLARRVLHPLLKHVGAVERWVLCPDGNLWLVPWNALPLPGGPDVAEVTYAVEKHTISYVTSGRDLVRPPAAAGRAPSAPLVLADPDFDTARAGPPQKAGPPGEEPLRAGELAFLRKRRPQRLEGAAREARDIAPKLERYAGAKPRVLVGDQAVKSAVQAAHGPRVLVFSTHGFFLPPDPMHPDAAGNPLLRCGLLLAGCCDPKTPEQGVLTGLEVIGTDLRGCELVVLSACETGLGEVQEGEGVAGLRQCFQLAGAGAVVATLWNVPDRPTGEQMERFFDLLAEGKNPAEALARAQRAMIAARRRDRAAANPFFWAAFTLTGPADRSTAAATKK